MARWMRLCLVLAASAVSTSCAAPEPEVLFIDCSAPRSCLTAEERGDYHYDFTVRAADELAALLTGVARTRPVSLPSFAIHGPAWNPPGLICRDDRPGLFVRAEVYEGTSGVEENRSRYDAVAQHNAALLRSGALDPALGCTAAPPPYPG